MKKNKTVHLWSLPDSLKEAAAIETKKLTLQMLYTDNL